MHVLLTERNSSPYSEAAGGDSLSIINSAVLGQFMEMDGSFNLSPGILDQAYYDYKEKKYILKLKKDTYFHNGRLATAKDIEFSLLRGFFTKHRSFFKIYFENFPVGAGPYFIEKPGYNDGIVTLRKYNKSLKNAPDIINLYTYKDNNIKYDIVIPDIKEIEDKDLKMFQSEATDQIITINFSNIHKLGKNENFRKFLQAALNRKAMQQAIPSTVITYELLPKHFWGRADLPDPYNPELAQKLFNSLPKDLREKKWKIPVFSGNEMPENKKILIQIMTSQLKQYGFHVEFYPNSEKFLSKKTAENSPFSIAGQMAALVDPLILFSDLCEAGSDKYTRALPDPELEKLYKIAAKVASKSDRVESIRSLTKYVDSKAYVIPLLQRKISYYYNPARIKSLGMQNQVQMLNLANVELN